MYVKGMQFNLLCGTILGIIYEMLINSQYETEQQKTLDGREWPPHC